MNHRYKTCDKHFRLCSSDNENPGAEKDAGGSDGHDGSEEDGDNTK